MHSKRAHRLNLRSGVLWTKETNFNQHSRPSYSAIWDGFKERETFFLQPTLFYSIAPVFSLYSTFPLPIRLFSAKNKRERKTREDWFSAQIRFHLHREVLVWTVGEALRFGQQVVFFSAEWAEKVSLGNFILSSPGREMKLRKQTHQIWAKYSTSNKVLSS